MKRWLLVLLLALPACHVPTTIVTPQGKVAYSADQITVRVNELENAAIQANSTGGLPVATTRTIVTFCVQADAILKVTPAGWQASVAALWTQAKKDLPATTNVAVSAALNAVDVALAAFGG